MSSPLLQNDSPHLSVVIVNWNAARHLKTCLTSLGQSLRGISSEVLFIDNASEDGSVALVTSCFPWVNVIRNAENLGFVRGNNLGIEHARGSYILFLNPDTEIVDDAIGKLLHFMKERPATGVVGPLLLNSDSTPQNSYFGYPGFWTILVEHILSARLMSWLEKHSTATRGTRRVDVIRGACLMSRLDLVRKVGGMNPHLFMYSEETDLCYKIHRLGFTIEYYPFARVFHYQRGSVSAKPEPFVAYHYLRSRLIFISENYNAVKARLLVGMIIVSLRVRIFIYRLLRSARARDFQEVLDKCNADGLL